MRPAGGLIRCDDFTCISIDGEMQLPPSPFPRRFLHMADVNPDSCTIDQQMDRPIGRLPTKSNVTELLQPPRQRGVIGDR
jgi:hypothetical protein